jgi:hypothetical protein
MSSGGEDGGGDGDGGLILLGKRGNLTLRCIWDLSRDFQGFFFLLNTIHTSHHRALERLDIQQATSGWAGQVAPRTEPSR